ncbi:hypothetical protein EVAR_72432_1 [Eumeta japonica]|uniref:Reverse transcriptase zinc-binding domain-containing protein n=1 Tax=Eumeta variegata TaxID=151549 RepID=A0A4C1SV79_EUMVA|nr:hypothetical protein EVAR_72432_1 [Eumeta japonica]
MAVSVITGHCTFGNHARRLGLPYNDFCRSCHDEEEEETVLHLLGTCRALESLRARFLQGGIFSDLSELSTVNLGALVSFIWAAGGCNQPILGAAILRPFLSHLSYPILYHLSLSSFSTFLLFSTLLLLLSLLSFRVITKGPNLIGPT